MEKLFTIMHFQFAPEGRQIHGSKMTNLIDHVVKNTILMGLHIISPELMKNIACVGLKINRIKQKKVPV